MENTFNNIDKDCPVLPSAGLFDRIIAAISQEKELKKGRKLLGLFIILFAISLLAMPFSTLFFMQQWQASGSGYFISAAVSNVDMFIVFWPDFMLSILESLPVLAITLLVLDVILLLFSVRLFLYRKGLLLKCAKHYFIRYV
jgi:hypothetical protein